MKQQNSYNGNIIKLYHVATYFLCVYFIEMLLKFLIIT